MKYEPLVSLENISFGYSEDHFILREIDFEIEEGERVLLIGPSGCGKSTFAFILAGLVPDYVYGYLTGGIYYRPLIENRIGLVFQDPEQQFVTFRVMDEVAFGPENLGFKPSKIMSLVEKSLEFVNMFHKKDSLLTELSGGEKQRIALASVMAMEPNLIILDEPTSMLDPAATENFTYYMSRIDTRGLLIIEHKIDNILDSIDRVVAMGPDGSIAFSGTASEVFVGHLNDLLAHGTSVPRGMLIIKEFQERKLINDVSTQFIPFPQSVARKIVSSGVAQKIKEIAYKINIIRNYKSDKVVLRARNLTYTYPDGTKAVDNVSLEIREGEIVAVVGRNGSGKTTLMDILAGIKRPDEGFVEFLGKKIEEYSPEEYFSMIGYVFQNPEYQFIMPSVFEEIAYEFRKAGFDEGEVHKRTMELLNKLLLDDKADRNPFRLSQGEKRRLSLGSAFVGNKKLMILDEPTFGQDRRAALRLIHLGKELSDGGTAMFVVTHDIDVAFEECDRIIVMSLGEIIWDGPPYELVENEDLMLLGGLRPPTVATVSMEIAKMMRNFPLLTSLYEWREAAELVKEMEEGR